MLLDIIFGEETLKWSKILAVFMLIAKAYAAEAETAPPTPDRWDASKQYVQVDHSVKMAYVEWGDLQAKPVILVHGYSDSSFAYSGVAPLMKGYHFIALDLRAHGDSSAPDCCYAVTDLAADLNAFIDAMGFKKVSIVGHSLGSLTAGVFSSLHPEKLDKLVLISSAVQMNKGTLDWLYDRVTQLEFPLSENGDFIKNEWVPNPNNIYDASFIEHLRKDEARMPKQAWVGIVKNLEVLDWKQAARHISAPMLIMWGDKDELITEPDQEVLRKAIPHAKFLRYVGLGHSMYWEDPARGAADIMNFLNSEGN